MHRWSLTILIACLAGPAYGASPKYYASTEAARFITRLGDASLAERELARRGLVALGEDALDALRLAAADSPDVDVRLRIFRTIDDIRKKVCAGRCLIAKGGPGLLGAALSADDRFVASGGEDNKVYLWDAQTGKALRQFDGHTAAIAGVNFSPDARLLVSGSRNGELFIWDRESGKKLVECKGHTGDIYDPAFSPDGKQVLAASTSQSDWTIRLWDVATGKELRQLKADGIVRSAALAPDGKHVASGMWDRSVRLWDLQTGKEIRAFKGHTGVVMGVAFSPDGKQLVSIDNGAIIRLWDVETGAEVRRFVGGERNGYCARFSPDGKRIITSSEDPRPRLWDVASGKEMHCYEGHAQAAVARVQFSSDGRRILSAARDGQIFVWGVPRDDPKPKTVTVVIETDKGDIEVELEAARAPRTVENFLRYVDGKFYDNGGRFHRTVTPDNQPDNKVKIEVVQAGINPDKVKDEFAAIKLERTRDTKLSHKDGTLSMARDGPDTATSDFFICIGDQPDLDFGGKRNPDGEGFAAFGRVVKGMDVVKKIQASAAAAEGQTLKPPIKIVKVRRKS